MSVVDDRGDDAGVVLDRARVVLGPERSPLPGRYAARQARTSSSSGAWSRGRPMNAVEEARFVDAARRRQDRPGGPFDPVRQRALRELRASQPPLRSAVLTDADQRRVVVAPQLLADQVRDHLQSMLHVDPVGPLHRPAARHDPVEEPRRGELCDDGADDARQSGRLSTVA